VFQFVYSMYQLDSKYLMQKTVYYLTHKDTDRRLKWYKTLTGARIAQRARNHRLGFLTRIERVYDDNTEYELCMTTDNLTMTATYCIVEDTIESALDNVVE
jgi:predicted RecB family nuclease